MRGYVRTHLLGILKKIIIAVTHCLCLNEGGEVRLRQSPLGLYAAVTYPQRFSGPLPGCGAERPPRSGELRPLLPWTYCSDSGGPSHENC